MPRLRCCKKWYTEFLGQEPYFDMPFYVGYNIDGAELGLDPDCTNVINGTNSYALWSVADIEAAATKATSLNGSIFTPITTVSEKMKVAVVKDPWQNCIGLIEEK